MSTVPKVGVRNERRTEIGPWRYLKRQNPLLELPRRLLALRRQTLGSERHRYATALPDKLGTDPVAADSIKKWTPSRKAGGIP